MRFAGPARTVHMSEADALAEAEAQRKIDLCNKILGKIAVTCLVVISLQACLLLPVTVIAYGWA